MGGTYPGTVSVLLSEEGGDQSMPRIRGKAAISAYQRNN